MKDERQSYKNDIKGHHYVCLRILEIFDKICRQNKIEYWITDGTLLGAVRHKGFIPWDDDIDVCVHQNDYKRMINVLKENLPDDLFLQTANTDLAAKKELFLEEEDGSIKFEFCKIRDKNSLAIEKGKSKCSYHMGIWIDIFPMSDISNVKLANKLINKLPQFEKANTNIKKAIIKKILLKGINLLGYTSYSLLKKDLYKTLSKNKNKNTHLIYMKGELWWNLYDKEIIYPLKEIEFENKKFYAPKDEIKYLESYYGKNFMEIPPLEKRIIHCEEININTKIK